MTRSLFVVVAVLAGLPGAAWAQGSEIYNPVVGGMPVSCVSYTGQPVAFLPDLKLQDVGKAYAEEPGTPPHIEYNPVLLSRLPPLVQLFWYGHVCAHEVLADADSEQNADRWALQMLKQQRLLTREEVFELRAYFSGTQEAPWSHQPESTRLWLFDACYEQKPKAGWFERPWGTLRFDQYQGVKRWRFCSSIPGVSTPTSSGHVSRLSCEEERMKLLMRGTGYVVTECLLTSVEHCPAN